MGRSLLQRGVLMPWSACIRLVLDNLPVLGHQIMHGKQWLAAKHADAPVISRWNEFLRDCRSESAPLVASVFVPRKSRISFTPRNELSGIFSTRGNPASAPQLQVRRAGDHYRRRHRHSVVGHQFVEIDLLVQRIIDSGSSITGMPSAGAAGGDRCDWRSGGLADEQGVVVGKLGQILLRDRLISTPIFRRSWPSDAATKSATAAAPRADDQRGDSDACTLASRHCGWCRSQALDEKRLFLIGHPGQRVEADLGIEAHSALSPM